MVSRRKLVLVALAAGLSPVLAGMLVWLTVSGGLVPADARPALALIAALSALAVVVMFVLASARRPASTGGLPSLDESDGSAAGPEILLRLARAFSLERRDLRGAAVSRFLLYAVPSPPRLSPFPLNDVVAICVDAMPQANGRRPAARVVFDPAADAGYCNLDPDQFHQVLLNLILNARDAAKATGLVSVRTQRIEDSVLVAVRDDGPGVPRPYLGEIFKPFRSAKPRALGIGLATCRAIVEGHGGTIDAMNILPSGLEVVIHLPRVAAPRAAAPASVDDQPALSTARPAASGRA